MKSRKAVDWSFAETGVRVAAARRDRVRSAARTAGAAPSATRHAVLYDTRTGEHKFLENLGPKQAGSACTTAAVRVGRARLWIWLLAGRSNIWCVGGTVRRLARAQVIIAVHCVQLHEVAGDSGLVVLPHGYEGQGRNIPAPG